MRRASSAASTPARDSSIMRASVITTQARTAVSSTTITAWIITRVRLAPPGKIAAGRMKLKLRWCTAVTPAAATITRQSQKPASMASMAK